MPKYARNILTFFAALLLLTSLVTSCVKEEAFLDDATSSLRFSADTLAFDTVFATMGTATRQVLVYNPYDEPVLLNRVTLKNGQSSRFRLNVDGDTSMVVRDVTLRAHDSLYIFVQACINPNSSTSPFLVEDAIVFDYCGHHQNLVLTAYGRNAIYHMPTDTIWDENHNPYICYSKINCTGWDHTRPHVIVDYAVVDSDSTLNLTSGDELYFATDACLWVFEGGSLKASGTKDSPVLFTSVRHDGWYDTLPGQWGYIWLYTGSIDNELNYVEIENSYIGLLVDTNVNANPTLKITNSKIHNVSNTGIFSRGAYVEGDNLLITTCGEALLGLQIGGRYRFCNSTFANYWKFGSTGNSRNLQYALALSNWYESISGQIIARPLEAEFRNCIFDGIRSKSDDGLALISPDDGAQFSLSFDHCLIKSENAMRYAEQSLLCEDPLFVSPQASDYHLQENSPAVAAGNSAWITIPTDLDGNPRGVPPCVGAYELSL